MAEEEVEITQQDIDSFKQKLDAWGDTLEPAEKALLATVIAQASGESPEVEGFTLPGFGDAVGSFLSSSSGGTGRKKDRREVRDLIQAPEAPDWLQAAD